MVGLLDDWGMNIVNNEFNDESGVYSIDIVEFSEVIFWNVIDLM